MPDSRETLVRKMIAEGTSDDDIRATLKLYDARQSTPAPKSSGWPAKIADVGIGFAKGLGSTVAGLGEIAANAGVIPGVTPAGFSQTMRHPLFTRAEEAFAATNTPQKIGKVAETVAELAVPAIKGARAIPSAARAGRTFQDVMGAAKSIPIDITHPGNVALRIAELGERGGTMPRPVTQFLRRVTDPEKAPMNYEEARDFASNISRLSADEFNRLTPVVRKEVAGLRVALNKSVADAAKSAGKGKEYVQAMSEYAKAMKMRDALDAFKEGAKGALPKAIGGGALGAGGALGWWLSKQLRGGE